MFEQIRVRKGQPEHKLSKEEFLIEFKKSFFDHRFRALDPEIEALAEIAYLNYQEHNKAPYTTKAGDEFSDPNYDLSVEWLETRNRLLLAEKKTRHLTFTYSHYQCLTSKRAQLSGGNFKKFPPHFKSSGSD